MDKNSFDKSTDATNTTGKDFVPPRHWVGPEELEASYWSNPSVQEKRAQEFHEKPIELIDTIDRIDKAGIARRDFLTVMGASMAMASFACARRPVHKIIPYVVKPEEITPGVPNWYASTQAETGCGILVKTREGRPIKIEGNPDHPLNLGKISARDQASVLGLYDPDRLQFPVIRDRSGGRKESTWTEVDSAITAKLKGMSRVRILSGEVRGESTQKLIQDFLSAFPHGEHVIYEPLALEEVSEAQELSYGSPVLPHYRFDQAEVILSLGADFLGTWPFAVEYAGLWAKNRKLDSKKSEEAKLSKLICFESTMTLTGANADERHALRPGEELGVALALARELAALSGGASALLNSPEVASILAAYPSETVARSMNLAGGAATLKKIANRLWAARGKSLVVAGGIHAKTRNAVALQVAVNLINSVLGNEGVTVDGVAKFSTVKSRFSQLTSLIQEMNQGKVDALIVYRSNPAYAFSHSAFNLRDAMKKVPLVIVVSDYENETAMSADFVLPDHHFLENWGDYSPKKGIYSIQQPVLAPIFSSRAFEDSLITWGKSLGRPAGALTQAADWHGYLQNHWKDSIYRTHSMGGSFEQFWEGILRQGVFVAESTRGGSSSAARVFKSASMNIIPKTYSAPAMSGQALLALYTSVAMYDGRDANNAWLQELPDPISSVTWDNYLNISPKLAKQLGLIENDVVQVAGNGITVELPVHIQPGMHPEVVSAAVGYGRRAAGKVGNGTGIDVYPFAKPEGNSLVYSGQSVTLKKTGRTYSLAATQWHTVTENRPVINDITLAEFRENPAATNEQDPELRPELASLWSGHQYKGYRWGMAIDLNSCIGCGACAIGCQAENNIPVVGRDQVRNSRQMHWIRIDRYYSGSAERPDMVFQPMLCQHCENAPCETVCPVLATVHDDEGLNVQVYNRCVGTRYCQNNCPYKVRRFNFFDHWKTYEGTMNLVWNPDVTVRTRGIMEKCTFCVQRIREAKDTAKDEGMKVKDGDLKTACQQTCPTHAIIFGDLNDPNSRVSQLRSDRRAFRVLDSLNTKPMVSYMTKVRNKGKEG